MSAFLANPENARKLFVAIIIVGFLLSARFEAVLTAIYGSTKQVGPKAASSTT